MHAWNNKVVVITGAGSGIGQAVALHVAELGCHIALVDINEKGLMETQEKLTRFSGDYSSHVVDVTNKGQMQELPEAVIKQHGVVDVLFNNAGITINKTFNTHTLEDWEQVVGINLWGVIYGCKFFMPYLTKQSEAFIINTSSLAGFLGMPNQTSYCVTKAAVKALSEALYAECKGNNIHVISVHPGAINTKIFDFAIQHSDDQEASKKMFDKVKRFAMQPHVAAEKIIGATVKKRQRIVIGADAYIVDIIKRLMPVAVHRLFAWGFNRRIER
ncbi:hypothetical protein A9Q81_21115 [Gammaproteobacteria bacterium 42_54_T18]|nr:hypothetical protein A9Q81_21115 [Gammaproteobacteria bacterium 42_54_T18]